MTPERYAQIMDLFHRADGLMNDDRPAFLERECAGDNDLRHAVEAMLAHASGTPKITKSEGDFELRVPEELGAYKILRPLGEGGMGTVYLAEDQRLHRKVALKVLRGPATGSASMQLRLQREAEVASRLDHPGICRVYELGEQDGIPFIAMEYVKGSTLASLIVEARAAESQRGDRSSGKALGGRIDNAPGKLSDSTLTSMNSPKAVLDVVRLIEKTARALHIAHDAGLIHRDIKPQNIMITRADDPVLLDFGLARDETSNQPTLTLSGQLMGTPAYMAPEQIAAQQYPVDRRADVYSLGVTLYECLTLRRPFDSPTREGLYQAILTREAPDPRKHNQAITKDLLAVLQTALEKDRDRRYQTAEALADDLRSYCEGRPVSVKSISHLGRGFRWARRNPAASVVILLTVVLAGLGGFLVARWPDFRRGQVEKHQELVDSLLERGFMEISGGSKKRAVELFQRAIELSSQPPVEAVAGLALAHTAVKETDRALELLDEYQARGAAYSELIWLRAHVAREAGKKAEAAELEKRAGKPRDALAFFLLGTREMAKGESGDRDAFARAFEYHTKAILYSDRAPPLFHHGRAYAASRCKLREAALESADILTTRWPDSPSARFWVGFATSDMDMDRAIESYRTAIALKPDSANAHFNLGALLFKKGLHDEAIASVREGLRHDPDSAGAYKNLGLVLIGQRKLDDAIAAFRKAIQIDPRYSDAYSGQSMALRVKGLFDEAIASARKSIQLDPKNAGAHDSLARALDKTGRLDEAIASGREAVRLDPESTSYRYNLGDLMKEKGLLDAAIACYREAIRLGTDNSYVHYDLGDALSEKGLLDEAIAAYEEAIRLDPEDPDLHYDYGNALSRKGRLDEAIVAYKNAIRFDPDDVALYHSLGSTLSHRGRLDEAIEVYRESIRIDPRDADSHYNLGNVLKDRGLLARAMAAYREAIRLEPELAEAHCNLGHVLKRSGRLREALSALRRGHALGISRSGWSYPSGKWVADCERHIVLDAVKAVRAGSDGTEEELQTRDKSEARSGALGRLQAVFRGWQADLANRTADIDRIKKIVRSLRRNRIMARLRDPDFLDRLSVPERRTWQDLWLLIDGVWNAVSK